MPVGTDIPLKPDTMLEQQGSEQLAPALPDEVRELISAVFLTDELDNEPTHMYAPSSIQSADWFGSLFTACRGASSV